MTDPVSRRRFLTTTSVAATTAAAFSPAAQGAAANPHATHSGPAVAHPAATATAAAVAPPATYRFFNPAEQAFVEAAVIRLIPPDDVGPSALESGVPFYIDLQLAGAWGAGERLYRAGPWQQGTPTQGYQLPFTPAELWRHSIRTVDEDVQRRHRMPFDKLQGGEQDAYLTELQTGDIDLGGVPGKVFFETLLAMTIEGYFSDPVYGGNRGMAAWKMIGFPGAYGAYYDMVDRHGVRFTGEPRSLAQGGDGMVHMHPNIPATVHDMRPAQSTPPVGNRR